MRNFLRYLTATDTSLAPVLSRIALGIVVLPHGLQKSLGFFGGYGFNGTVGYFTETVGLPWIIAVLLILGESVGALMLILGGLTRFAAASIAVIMVGAITMVHGQFGFFMNWFGTQAGEGYEYHLLAIGLALSLVVSGAGRWSVDRIVSNKLN